MRCHICDKALSETEITQLPDRSFDCCAVCLEVAMDAAYCDGFVKEDPLDDPELEEQFGNGAAEILDPGTYRSTFDHGDYVDGDDYD